MNNQPPNFPSKSGSRQLEAYLPRNELGIGIFLTALIAYLHCEFMFHAGGLWRDEAVSFNIAAKPSLLQTFDLLRFDSFPGLVHFLLHIWNALGFAESDLGIRGFGFVVGCGTVATLWFNGLVLGGRVPLFALVFFGLLSWSVRATDVIRGYGIGILCILLTAGLIWRVVESPSAPRVILAFLFAILSVQSLYQNAFSLLSICVGAVAVTLRSKLWIRTLLVILIGASAAFSMLIYVGTVRRMADVKMLIVTSIEFPNALINLSKAICGDWRLMGWMWGLLFTVSIALAVLAHLCAFGVGKKNRERDLSLFASATMVCAVVAFFAWLRILNFPTQPWYYIPLIALMAVCMDAILSLLPDRLLWKIGRSLVALVIGVLLFKSALPGVHIRQTNVDLIAKELHRQASRGDFILVYPYYCGASFHRYYSGTAPWSTLPPLEDQTLQRLDSFKQFMIASHPIDPVLEKMKAALQSGHKIWLVGGLPAGPPGTVPPDLPPAPNSRWGWDHDAYSEIWGMQAMTFLQSHALKGQPCPPFSTQRIDQREDLPVLVVEGWR